MNKLLIRHIDQLTVMIESSRLFLWTEYARKGCGTIETHGTNYKVWDSLPVRLLDMETWFYIDWSLLANFRSQDRFSSNKRAQELLARIKEDKVAEKQRLAPYYFGGFSHGANTSDTDGVHREELEPYLSGKAKSNGTNGVRV
jgi:homogentisate 1,2-dioxygenase